MKTMYPGVANSPETFLTSALAADGTIMYLADGSVLGTLPTYAVIGDTASAETVLVQSKGADGGYNIQRAVEGVAIAWPQATLVARNFTNADYAALVDNMNTLDENKLDQSDMDAFQEEVQTALDGMSDDLANVQQEQATMQTEQAAKDAAQDESIAACALKTEIPTVVNDLSTGGETAALSAEQGKTLKTSVDAATSDISALETEVETLENSVQTMQTDQAEKDAAQDASIAACALKTEIPTIVDDLTTGGTTAALSAEQGKALKADVDAAAASFDEWKVPWTAERAETIDDIYQTLTAGGGDITKDDIESLRRDIVLANTGYLLDAYFIQEADFAADINDIFGTTIPETYETWASLLENADDLNAALSNNRFAAAVANSVNAIDIVIEAGEDVIELILANDTVANELATNTDSVMKMLANVNIADIYAASSTAMSAVAASSTAMSAVAASSTAMSAIINNSSALNTVVNSSTAMSAVAANSTALTTCANNATVMAKIVGTAVAMKSIWQVHKSQGVAVAFCRKFNVSLYTNSNVAGAVVSSAWLNTNSASSNSNTLHTNSMPNDVMIVQSSGEALTYDAIELTEGSGSGVYGTNNSQNSGDGTTIFCKTANQILFTYSAQKCFRHADSSNSAPQKLSRVVWN